MSCTEGREESSAELVWLPHPINLARTMELKLSGDAKLNPGPAARKRLGKLTNNKLRTLSWGPTENCRVMGPLTSTSMLYREKTCST